MCKIPFLAAFDNGHLCMDKKSVRSKYDLCVPDLKQFDYDCLKYA